MSIEQSVYERWNNTSLDSTIAELYPGTESESDSESVPEGTALPRAEYFVGDNIAGEHTRNKRIHMIPVTFRVYCGGEGSGLDEHATALSYQKSIIDAFVNAERAGTNKMCENDQTRAIVHVGFSYARTARIGREIAVTLVEIIVHHTMLDTVPS